MTNSYNQRQITMILDRIKWYKDGKITLGRLVNELEALLNALRDKDKIFEDEFISYWGSLEIVYSFMLYEKRKVLDQEDKEKVNQSLESLKKIIHSYYKKESS